VSGRIKVDFCFILVPWLVVLCLFGLTGCENKSERKDSGSAVTTQRSTMETITIYSNNSDNMSLIPVSVKKISDDNSLDYICSLVMENLNEDNIKVTECKMEGKKAIVSFSSKGKPVRGCSEKMENLILESFANSLLDNAEGCEKIIFRADGGAYESSHNSFGINEVYASE
jgi:hypothetical protein